MATAAENIQDAIDTLTACMADVKCCSDPKRVEAMASAISKLQDLQAKLEPPFEIESRAVT